MNCPNCGASNAPETNFCISCGTALPKEAVQPAPVAPVAEPVPAAPAAPAAEPKSGNILTQLKDTLASVFKPLLAKKGLLTAIIGGVALLLVAAILCGIFVPTEKTPVKDLINITLKGDFDKLEKLLPEDFIEWYEDENEGDFGKLIESEEETADKYLEALEEEYGEKIRISFKVTEKKVLSDKKLDNIKDSLKEIGINKKDVKKAVQLDVDYTIKGSDDNDEDDFKITVVKIGGKWYALNQYEYYGLDGKKVEGYSFCTSAFDFLNISFKMNEKGELEVDN